MDFVDVDGLRIAYEQRGSGPPLVLVHGLPGDSRMWRPQLESLSDAHTVVAWDAPGCGQSSDPTEPWGTADVARCLVGTIRALGLERPHVLGLSWGTGLTIELCRQAPDLSRSVVLASGYAGWGGSLPADAVAARLDAYLAASRDPSVVRGWAGGFFSPSAPPARVEELLDLVVDLHPGPLAAYARSFAETDLRDVLPTIAVPTLVLAAGADTRSPMEVSHALHAAIPGSQLVVLEDVGHVSNLEAPERFDAAVRGFLARTEPAQ